MNIDDLTSTQIDEIADQVAGGCDNQRGEDMLVSLGLSAFDLEEVCAKVEQFRCPGCSWWGHPGEILEFTNSNDEGICNDCYDEEGHDVED